MRQPRAGLAATLGWSLAGLGLFAFAVALTWKWGMRGIVDDADPLFYGGWLMAGGAIPFVDAFTSWGVVPSLLQGAVFRLFGTGWTTYVGHAAVWNGLFAVLLWAILRRLGLGPATALVYAALASATYYAPVGHPHPDKHGILFLLAATGLQLLALTEGASRLRVALCAMGAVVAFALAFFSKGNPTVAYGLALLVPTLALPRAHWAAAALGIVGGLAIVGAVLAALLPLNASALADIFYYQISLPRMVAAMRQGEGMSLSLTKLSDFAGLGTFNLVWGLAVGVCLLAWQRRHAVSGSAWVPIGLGLSFLAVTLFHLITIRQPPSIHVTLVIPAIACLHAGALAVLGRDQASRPVGWLLAAILLGHVTVDVKEYDRLVSGRREGYDKDFMLGDTMPAGAMGVPGFERVQFIPFRNDADYLDRLRETMAVLKGVEGNVHLLRLSQMYYPLAGKAAVVPAIYVIAGHSTPPLGSEGEARLVALFHANLMRANVRTVVVRADYAPVAVERISVHVPVCAVMRGHHVWRVDLCRSLTPADAGLAQGLFRHDLSQ